MIKSLFTKSTTLARMIMAPKTFLREKRIREELQLNKFLYRDTKAMLENMKFIPEERPSDDLLKEQLRKTTYPGYIKALKEELEERKTAREVARKGNA